jgi:hypothetical protein
LDDTIAPPGCVQTNFHVYIRWSYRSKEPFWECVFWQLGDWESLIEQGWWCDIGLQILAESGKGNLNYFILEVQDLWLMYFQCVIFFVYLRFVDLHSTSHVWLNDQESMWSTCLYNTHLSTLQKAAGKTKQLEYVEHLLKS